MKNVGLGKMSGVIGEFILKKSPELLTGIGVAGLITTTIMAVKATPKAMQILAEEQERRKVYKETENYELIPKLDIVKLTWKTYVPTAIMAGVTIACIIGANSISNKRNAALAAMYTLTETSLRDYKESIKEHLTKDKADKMNAAIKAEQASDAINKNPPVEGTIILTGQGDTLCYDKLSGRYFKSDIEGIRKIQNNINERLLDEMRLSLNDVYYELGLANIKLGDMLGFDIEHGQLDFAFSSVLAKDGTPCLVIDLPIAPIFM